MSDPSIVFVRGRPADSSVSPAASEGSAEGQNADRGRPNSGASRSQPERDNAAPAGPSSGASLSLALGRSVDSKSPRLSRNRPSATRPSQSNHEDFSSPNFLPPNEADDDASHEFLHTDRDNDDDEKKASKRGSELVVSPGTASNRSRTRSALERERDEEDKESEVIPSRKSQRSRVLHEISQESKHYEGQEIAPLNAPPLAASGSSVNQSVQSYADIELKTMDSTSAAPLFSGLSPLPSAPMGSEGGDSDSDGETDAGGLTSADVQEVFRRPLIYYRRQNANAQRNRSSYRSYPQDQPTQIFLPNQTICLGFPFSRSPAADNNGQQQDAEQRDLDNLVVFANPTEEQFSRSKVFLCLLYFLIPIDLALISTLYFYHDLSRDTTFSNGSSDTLTYSCTVIELILAIIAMHSRDTRLISAFIMIYYVDSLINLVRAYSVLQFTHFVLQLGICHVMNQLLGTNTPLWYTPVQ